MRLYYVQIQNSLGEWITGAKEFRSCKKAHTAARRVRSSPARVLMQMKTISLKALTGQA